MADLSLKLYCSLVDECSASLSSAGIDHLRTVGRHPSVSIERGLMRNQTHQHLGPGALASGTAGE